MKSVFLKSFEAEEALSHLLKEAQEEAFFASAYCKVAPITRLLSSLDSDIPVKRLVVRWSPEDLIQGASDLDVYKVVRQYGWELFINLRLHAKTYIFDDAKAVIGSANLTDRGLGALGERSNDEMSCLCNNLDGNLLEWKERIISESCLVNDDIFAKIKAEIEKMKMATPLPVLDYSANLLQLLNNGANIQLFTKDFPWTATPEQLLAADSQDAQHDKDLLGITDDMTLENLKFHFANSKVMVWLGKNCEGEINFGELTKRLHDALRDDPRPYRKTVKELLSNLITWAATLCPEAYVADQPNHSTRLRKIANSNV